MSSRPPSRKEGKASSNPLADPRPPYQRVSGIPNAHEEPSKKQCSQKASASHSREVGKIAKCD